MAFLLLKITLHVWHLKTEMMTSLFCATAQQSFQFLLKYDFHLYYTPTQHSYSRTPTHKHAHSYTHAHAHANSHSTVAYVRVLANTHTHTHSLSVSWLLQLFSMKGRSSAGWSTKPRFAVVEAVFSSLQGTRTHIRIRYVSLFMAHNETFCYQ